MCFDYCNLQQSRAGNMVKSEPSPRDTFFIKKIKNKDPLNWYCRKQPTHFSTTPLKSKSKKKKFFDPMNEKFRTHKKMPLKSQAKTKPYFP